MEETDIVNGDFSKKSEYQELFQKFLSDSGLVAEEWTVDHAYKGFSDVTTVLNGGKFVIHVHFRNITGACLPYNMKVRRIQVGALEAGSLPQNKQNEISILGGFCHVGSTPIFAAWNAFHFTEHKKNRSCYITPETILAAENKGFWEGMYNGIPVYVCDSAHLQTLLSTYIGENSLN
jgi:hypothetical protein